MPAHIITLNLPINIASQNSSILFWASLSLNQQHTNIQEKSKMWLYWLSGGNTESVPIPDFSDEGDQNLMLYRSNVWGYEKHIQPHIQSQYWLIHTYILTSVYLYTAVMRLSSIHVQVPTLHNCFSYLLLLTENCIQTLYTQPNTLYHRRAGYVIHIWTFIVHFTHWSVWQQGTTYVLCLPAGCCSGGDWVGWVDKSPAVEKYSSQSSSTFRTVSVFASTLSQPPKIHRDHHRTHILPERLWSVL